MKANPSGIRDAKNSHMGQIPQNELRAANSGQTSVHQQAFVQRHPTARTGYDS